MNYKILLSAIFLAGIVAPASVLASAFVFENKIITAPVGKIFTLPVAVNPTGEKLYTARLILDYPADTLEVASFGWAANWLAVPQIGYDLIDNKQGVLIKTAGFPAGFAAPVPFGIITFRSKRAGAAVIRVGPRSFILNAANQSTLESRPQVRVAITEKPTAAPAALEPLADLPLGEQNLFDIISAPAPKASRHLALYFAGFAIAGVFIVLLTVFLITRVERWRLNRKLKPEGKNR